MNSIHIHEIKNANAKINRQNQSPKVSLEEGNEIEATLVETENKQKALQMENGEVINLADDAEIKGNVGDTLSFRVEKHEAGNKSGVVLKQMQAAEELFEAATDAYKEKKEYSKSEIMDILKNAHLPATNENIKNAKILKENNLEIQAKTLKTLSEIKKQVDLVVNNTNEATLSELAQNGISVEKLSLGVLSSVVTEVNANPFKKEISPKELAEAVEKYFKSHDITPEKLEKKSEYIKTLAEEDIPVNEKNINIMESVDKKIEIAKHMDESTIIKMVEKEKPLTVENAYISTFTASNSKQKGKQTIDNKAWEALRPETEKFFAREGIEPTKENMATAKTLIENDVPLTKENMEKVEKLKNLAENIDEKAILKEAIKNIKANKQPSDVDLFVKEKSNQQVSPKEAEELAKQYESLIEEFPQIKDETIQKLVEEDKPVTVKGLQEAEEAGTQETPETPEMKATVENETESEHKTMDISVVRARRQLGEIQLRLTAQVAGRLSKQNIDINIMPLHEAVTKLKEVETEINKANLKMMGAEVSDENVAKMDEIFDKVRELSDVAPKTIADVARKKIPFTIQEVSESSVKENEREVVARAYDSPLTTAPNAKFGDSLRKVEAQIPEVLERLDIEPTVENIRAASILVKSQMELTEQNMIQVAIIDDKLTQITDKFQPMVAASMLKDGLNPLTMHVDSVMEYINGFNEILGDADKNSVAQNLIKMDENKEITNEERSAMVAVYRMINTIQKTNGAAVGVTIKENKEMTLGNLMEASKYFERTKARKQDMNVSIDDSFGGLADVKAPAENIKAKINSYLEKMVDAVEEGQQTQVKTTLEQANMEPTTENVRKAIEVINQDMELTPENITKYSYHVELIKNLEEFSMPKSLKQFFERIDKQEIENIPLEKIVSELKQIHKTTAKTDDAAMPKEQLDNYLEKINNLGKMPASVLQWIESKKMPATLNTTEVVNNMMKDPFWFGTQINKLASMLAGRKGNFGEQLPTPALKELQENKTPEKVLEALKSDLVNVSKDLTEFSPEERKLIVAQTSIVANAAAVQNHLQRGGESFQIPMKLHDKITNLNMFVLNEEKVGSRSQENDIKSVISLDTTSLGKVQGLMTMNGDDVNFEITAKDNETCNYLNQNIGMLTNLFAEAGLNLKSVSFSVGGVQNVLENEITKNNKIDTKVTGNNKFEAII